MEYLRELNLLSMIVRIALSILIGGVLGMERGRKHRPAGFRTYILVFLGATLVMMTNQYVCDMFGTGDPVRLGAQVISGIGFLGAGTIVITGRSKVMGITTAACLWTAACCGLAIGIGYYEGAVAVGLAIVFTISGLQGFDNWIRKKSKYLDLYIEFNTGKSTFGEFLKYAKENKFNVKNIKLSREDLIHNENQDQKYSSFILTVSSNQKRTHAEMIDVLSNASGVLYVEEL